MQCTKPFISKPPELAFSLWNSANNSKAELWCILGCAEMRSSHDISKIKHQGVLKCKGSDWDMIAKATTVDGVIVPRESL